MGKAASATTTGTIAIGNGAAANGFWSVSIGASTTTVEEGVAIGQHATTTATKAIAIGNFASASTISTAIGRLALARGNGVIAIGDGASTSAESQYSIAFGTTASVTSSHAISIGEKAVASADYCVTAGYQSLCNTTFSVSLGYQATSTISASVAIGANAFTLDAQHGLAFGLPAATLVPGTLGVSINGAPYLIDMYTQLYETTASTSVSLTAASGKFQVFTTASTIVTLPPTGTMQKGFYFNIVNFSSGNLDIRSFGLNLVVTLATNTWAKLVIISTATNGAAAWLSLGGGNVLN
jgi:hypothetical protein